MVEEEPRVFRRLEFLKKTLDGMEDVALKTLLELPDLFDLPFMEPRLLSLYRETYILTMFGMWNASFVMQGLLLEALTKEVIYIKEKTDFRGTFGRAIVRCKSRGYLDADEIEFLDKFNTQIRNRYQHIDIKEIAKGINVRAWKIPVKELKDKESLDRAMNGIRTGINIPQLIGYNELRPAGFLIKSKIDEHSALPQFLVVDRFVRKFAAKHFKPK